MATNYTQQYALLSDQHLFEKAHQAVVKVALDIASESTATAGHVARAAYAQAVLANPSSFTRALLPGIVADTLSDANATDSTLYNRLAAIWNAYAGA